MIFVSKPTEIEAEQWTGDAESYQRIEAMAIGKVRLHGVVLHLLAGQDGAQEWVPVPVGHWVVHNPGDQSDFWPVHDERLQAKYEPQQESA